MRSNEVEGQHGTKKRTLYRDNDYYVEISNGPACYNNIFYGSGKNSNNKVTIGAIDIDIDQDNISNPFNVYQQISGTNWKKIIPN